MLARILPSARKLLLRPAVRGALPPLLAASVGTIYSTASNPSYCMHPHLEPEALVDEVADSIDERLEAAREFVARDRARSRRVLEESEEEEEEEAHTTTAEVLGLQDKVRSDLFPHDAIIIGIGKPGTLYSPVGA